MPRPNRIQRRAMVAAGIGMALASLAGLAMLVWSPPHPVSSAPRLQAASPCTVETTTVLEADEVGADETVGITFTAKTTCPAEGIGPLHIAFVMQASSPMARDPDTGEHPQAEMRAAALEIVESLDLEANPWIRVAIVEYSDSANTLCNLTNDPAEIAGCIASVKSSGDTNLVRGIEGGERVLAIGRRAAPASLSEVMLIFGDMSNDFGDPRTAIAAAANMAAPRQAGCDSVVELVDEIKAENPSLLIGTVCVGGCDVTCARRIATSTGYVFNTDRLELLITTLGRIVDSIRGAPVKSLTVDVTLDPTMGFVAESAEPAATVEDGRVVWDLRGPSALDAVLRMRLAPLVPDGPAAACAMAEGRLVDGSDRVATFELECPELTVVPSEATATPSPEPTEPATDTPTSETPDPETPEPGETPSAEPPSGEPRIYMPIARDGA